MNIERLSKHIPALIIAMIVGAVGVEVFMQENTGVQIVYAFLIGLLIGASLGGD